MRCPTRKLLVAIIAIVLSAPILADEPPWVRAMRDVHARGGGERGVLLHMGDSITYSMAYFAPLQYAAEAKMSPATRRALETVDRHMKKDCYRWKGEDKGNYSGQTASWGLANADGWIAALKPEAAVIMFGTNDIRRGSVEAHEKDLRLLVQKCLDKGVVVILSTIPPMHGFDEKVRQAVDAQRRIAADLNVPLVDFHAHVANRRPNDWDGMLEQFQGFSQWEVPTIISQDGVHPSNPRQWQGDYTEEGLTRNGNVLRTYLTLMAYAEVIRVAIDGQSPTEVSSTILGANPPKPADLPRMESSDAVPPDNNTASSAPLQDWFPKAPPLAAPTSGIVEVGTVDELFDAAESVKPGGTILVADGMYRMPLTLTVQTDNVTLRGKSGRRDKVILDFTDCRHHEGVAISRCRGVTIADLTVQNVRQNGIKINSNLGVDRVTIYNVISHNVWQRHIKGPGVPDENGQPSFVEDCRVQYCLFYNDRPKREGDEPWEDENSQFGFNYIGGMDIMNARNWVISDNVFTGIHGKSGEARGAIFLWHNTSDCVIERNVIIDCDSGICLGNSSARGERRHANGVIVRNNFVVRCHENNILADHTRDCGILHNTVHDPDTPNGRLLRVVHANDGLVVANNLFSGPRIVVELNEGPMELRDNLIRPVGDYFVDPANGNLHLKAAAPEAIDKATRDKKVAEDIDAEPRGDRPDLGADEWNDEA
jgi:hypothetical protein